LVKLPDKNVSGRKRLLPGLRVKDGYLRHPFDIENGVETSGLIDGEHLISGHLHDRHNTAYFGVAPSVFKTMFTRWRRTIPRRAIGNYCLVDIGCGMGRAMLMAAEMPFREVIGVELHPELIATAEKNIKHWSAAGRTVCPMNLLLADATEFEFPEAPCVLFLFNPFGATVLRRLIKRIEREFAGRPLQLDLIYVNCEHDALLNGHKKFEQLWSGEVRKSRKDEKADRAIIHNQVDDLYVASESESCSIYRWAGRC
jgi:predicted RNA methylase